MFVKVALVRRMPRRFDVFDYVKTQPNLKRGDLVSVPFKSRDERAIVIETAEESDVTKPKPVNEILVHSYLSDAQIDLYQEIAFNTSQSLSSILHFACSPSKPQKQLQSARVFLKRFDIPKLTNEPISGHLRKQIAACGRIVKNATSQTLILCPDNIVAAYVSTFLHATVLSGASFDDLRSWRNGSMRVAVGVRTNTLHPAKQLSDIILLDGESELYRKLNKNPRIHLPSAAESMARHLGAKLHHIGYSYPLSGNTQLAPSRVIHLHQSPMSDLPLISDEVFELLGKKSTSTLIIYNRKGHAKKLQCSSCQYIPFCDVCGGDVKLREDDLVCVSCGAEMWYPKACPACKIGELKFKQLGINFLSKQLSQHFENVRIINSVQHDAISTIDLATEKFFYQASEFGRSYNHIVNLAFDFDLQHLHYRALAVTRYKLERFLHVANALSAESYLQTWDIELFEKIASRTFPEDELNARTLVLRPPISGEIVIEGEYKAPAGVDFSEHSDRITLFPDLDILPKLLHDLNELDDSVKISNYSTYAKNRTS